MLVLTESYCYSQINKSEFLRQNKSNYKMSNGHVNSTFTLG